MLQDDDMGKATISLRFDTQVFVNMMPPPSAWGSAERRGCTLRPRSA
jgi:hypothetical protein